MAQQHVYQGLLWTRKSWTMKTKTKTPDVPPPLVGEDIIGGVADCAAAVTRERVEPVPPMTGRKVNRRRSRYARMSCSHGTTSDESDDDVDERPPPPPPPKSGVPGSK